MSGSHLKKASRVTQDMLLSSFSILTFVQCVAGVIHGWKRIFDI